MNPNLVRAARAGWIALVLSFGCAAADERSVGEIDFSSTVSFDIRHPDKGKIVGIVRNDGEVTIRNLVVLVKHSWVWPDARRGQPDSYSHTEYVSIDKALLPGERAAFASVHTPIRPALDEASFFADVKVTELTEIRYETGPAQ